MWFSSSQTCQATRYENSDAIAHLATHPEIVDRLQSNIRSLRTFAEIAIEMKTVYEMLLK
ncbi:hypothetical protein IQ250_10890 [Pseudanabaenaceae cyanobacterium LEGE 13415]|nr:hypothetical protein [Pseudanabaenaceae cyanobacterium LEGE 13415]